MRFALLLTAAAFVIAPAISQPLHTELFDVPVGDFPTDHGLENHSGDETLRLVTDANLAYTIYPPSIGNSTETDDAGFEDQLRGGGEYEATGFVQSQGNTTNEQSYASAAGMSWGMSLILTMAVLVMVLSILK